jgi:hypothetical protein
MGLARLRVDLEGAAAAPAHLLAAQVSLSELHWAILRMAGDRYSVRHGQLNDLLHGARTHDLHDLGTMKKEEPRSDRCGALVFLLRQGSQDGSRRYR